MLIKLHPPSGWKLHLPRLHVLSNLSLDLELNVHIGKAATKMARHSKQAWKNTLL